MTDITIVLPAGALGANPYDSVLDTILRELAIKCCEDPKMEWAEKYGTDFDNEVFMMHHYCWCDQETCPWCGDEEFVTKELQIKTGMEVGNEGRCAPNFWFKPLDFKVWWYKYIGRDTETNKEILLDEVYKMREKCLESLKGDKPARTISHNT